VPAKLMLRPLKVATPLTAFSVLVPDSTAPLVPVPVVIARLTGAVDEVNVLPLASCTATTGWVLKAVPAVLVVLGCVVIVNLAATPAVTFKALLIAEVSPVLEAVRVYPEPARLMLRPLKVATPLTALSVLVPDKTAPLVPVPMVIANVTDTVELTVLP